MKNIYITEKEFDKIYLYLNISNSIKTYKIMKLTDQNYEGLPIERKNKIMAKQHIIPINNGVGSKEIDNGTYTITANIVDYDNATIDPASQEITEGIDNYSFTIGATGTLTLHVSDDGTKIGIPIVGAVFYLCDAEGNQYGDSIQSDDSGNAVFNNVPYSGEGNAPEIYFKQISSDGEHTFNSELQNTTLTEETGIVEITNAAAAERTFNITDANLPIADGEITLEG